MKKLLAASGLLLLGAACGQAWAQVYVGAAAGVSYTPTECLRGYTCRNTDLGVKLYGGFALNPTLSIELGYVDFGKAEGDALGGSLHDEIGAKAVTVAAALRASFGPDWHGVARIGAASVDAKETHTFSVYNSQKTTTNLYLGLGLEYAFDKQFKAALMLDTTTGDTGATSGSIFLLGAGLQYAF